MNKKEVVLDEKAIGMMRIFQNVTHVTAQDCFITPNKLVFVVGVGNASKAVGKDGSKMIKLKEITKKDIQVIENSDDPAQFIMNMFHMYGPTKVELETLDNIVHATVTVDPNLKGKAIGKDGKNLKIARDVVNRQFDIQSLKVA